VGADVLTYAEPAAVVVVVAATWAGRVRGRQAESAALEAAIDDPEFAPEHLRATVAEIVRAAAELWADPDAAGPAARPDGWLIAAWARSKVAQWGLGVALADDPKATPLRVVNREGEDEDRVILRVRLRLRWRRRTPAEPAKVRLDERWTLGRHGGEWYLLSVDGDPLAAPVLSAPLIPTPADDDARLTASSLRELGQADAAPGARPDELVSPSAPGGHALFDLSLVDGRFLPALLGAALARLVESWEEATTGSDAPLRALAREDAVQRLLYPEHDGDRYRLMLRDAELVRWEVDRFDPAAAPPRVVVTVTVRAVRFVIDDETGERVAGSTSAPSEMRPAWTLELTDAGPVEWRLVAATDPVRGLISAA
jgi:hypothetical protein